MTTDELAFLSMSEATKLMRSGALSPLELTRACLERIQKLDVKVNSFITITAELALEQAKLAEQEQQRHKENKGKISRSLSGIPIALKDLFETKGVRTTAGSKFFANTIPQEDAEVVRRLAQAGAVFLGKTNLHEIALGVTNVNPHYGACHNPWALERISGGSSGGSAVAIAAGFCLGALGSDTGGSIRIPAALCGVVGFKPTFGRVSLRGVIPLSWHLDHVGPLARRVKDVAMLLQVIAGYDPTDPASVNMPVDDYLAQLEEGIHGWKVALADDEYFESTDEQVAQWIRQAATVFEQLGARVVRVAFPGAYEAALANGWMVVSDAAAFHSQRLQKCAQDFGADVVQRLQMGAAYPLTDYILARRTQTCLRRQFEQFFENFDILITPTTPIPAPPIEGQDALEQARLLTRYTASFNLTGLPALSLPCGFTPEGLPVGLQIVSAPWREAKILQAAFAYEQATDWHQRHAQL